MAQKVSPQTGNEFGLGDVINRAAISFPLLL